MLGILIRIRSALVADPEHVTFQQDPIFTSRIPALLQRCGTYT